MSAVVTLPTLTVFQGTDPDLGIIWADADDATYTTQYGDGGPPGPFPNFSGAFLTPYTSGGVVQQATIHVRASASRTDGLTDPILAEFDIVNPEPGSGGTPPATYATSTALFEIAVDGTIRDFDIEVTADDWAAFTEALSDTPGVECYFDAWFDDGTINRVLNVYEVSMTVGFVPLPLRLTPRDDGLGTSAAPRNWPVPKAARNTGRIP